MNIELKFYLEREAEHEDVLVTCSGRIEKHFGALEVFDFTSDRTLTPDEQEQAEEKLIGNAIQLCPASFMPEREPDARRYSNY